jgi:hypothetical protein
MVLPRRITPRQRTAIAVCVGNVLISICSSCFWYNELDRLNPFPYFANMLNVVLAVVLVGAALVATGGAGALAATARGSSLRWRQLVLQGSFAFALQNTLDIISIDGLGERNSNLSTVFQQAVIPVTLVLSRAMLGKRFTPWHLAGATLVVGGILVSYVPLAVQDADSSSGGGGGVPVGWTLVFLASRVPQALSNIFSEQALHIMPGVVTRGEGGGGGEEDGVKGGVRGGGATAATASAGGDGEVDSDGGGGGCGGGGALQALLSITLWTNIIAVPLNFLFSLLISGSGLTSSGDASVSDMLADYAGGWHCLFRGSCDPAFVGRFPDCPVRCETAWSAVLLFSVPGVLFAVSEFQVLQFAGASTYVILTAVELPLTNALMASPAIMGRLAGDFHASIVYGVFVMLPGMVLYGLADVWQQQQQQQQQHKTKDQRRLELAKPLLSA